MPFLPALFTVIGIGLQCKKELSFIPGQQGQHVMCSGVAALFNAVQWEREMSSLPLKVSRGLQKYEPELRQHLADYSKLCGMGLHDVARSNFLELSEVDIVQIFCPSE